MINSLDEELHWAALHYAVYRNNMTLCSILTDKKGDYRCGMLTFFRECFAVTACEKTFQM